MTKTKEQIKKDKELKKILKWYRTPEKKTRIGELGASIADLRKLISYLEKEYYLDIEDRERTQWAIRMKGGKYDDEWDLDFSCWEKKKK